jgi:hypothetical protein
MNAQKRGTSAATVAYEEFCECIPSNEVPYEDSYILKEAINVFLGSLWSAMLYSKGYIYYMTTSAWKNALYLPFQILLLVWILQAVLPMMHRMHWSPCQMEGDRLSWR